jgi:hypothetical protein
MYLVAGEVSLSSPTTEVAESREAMNATAGANRRWVMVQPDISLRFLAPRCYESGDPMHTLLTDFLTRLHPEYPELEKMRADLLVLKSTGVSVTATKAEKENRVRKIRSAVGEISVLADSIGLSVRNARASLLSAYQKHGDTTGDGTKGDPKTVTVQCREFSAKMTKAAARKDVSSVDKTMATCAARVLTAITGPGSAEIIRALTLALPLEQPAMAQKIDHTERAPGKVKTFTGTDAPLLEKKMTVKTITAPGKRDKATAAAHA